MVLFDADVQMKSQSGTTKMKVEKMEFDF